MNKKQLTVIWVIIAYFLLVVMMTFIELRFLLNIFTKLRNASLPIPFYLRYFVHSRHILADLFFPSLIIGSILLFILRDRKK